MFFSCLKRPRVFPRLPEDKAMARKGLEAPRGRPPRTPRPPRLCLQPPAPPCSLPGRPLPTARRPALACSSCGRNAVRPSVRPSAAPPQTARAHGPPLAAAGPCQPPATAGEGRVRLAREPFGPHCHGAPFPCASRRPPRPSTPLGPASADLLTTPPSLRGRPGLSRRERGRRAHGHDTRVCAHRARAHGRAPHACARGASASFAAHRPADRP